MSYALIEAALGEGLYRIKLDHGDAQRKALINANELAIAQITFKMDVARDAVLVAGIREAEARAAIDLLIQQLVIVEVGDPALAKLTRILLNEAKLAYGKLVANNSPARRQLETLKALHANGVQRRIKWNALVAIEFREAWCVDYSPFGEGTVATIDIPGDPTLILLAPGTTHYEGMAADEEFASTPRRRRTWDGFISNERKRGNIVALQARMPPLTAEHGDITNTTLPQAVALEAALTGQKALAQIEVQANPTIDNKALLSQATERLAAQVTVVKQLRDRQAVLIKQIKDLGVETALWMQRASSDSPNYGDGRYQLRDLCSPEQSYFNAAIFPGWQKQKPTYRWGTITFLDVENNLANVTLGAATSTAGPPAPRLDVNASPTLNGVPIRYMTCDAEAFEVGDNVVVGFGTVTVTEPDVSESGGRELTWAATQRWEEPVIIGFLDNPRKCRPWPISVTMDLVFETLIGPVGASIPWATVVWRNGQLGCPSGFDRTFFYYNVYQAEVAPPATHSLVLSAPVFGDPPPGEEAYEPYFTINVEGGTFGVPLWAAVSTAFGHDTGGGPTARVPSGGGPTSIGVGAIGFNIYESTTDAFTMGTASDAGTTYTDDACIRVNVQGSGAWIHPGSADDGFASIEPIPFTVNDIIDEPSAFSFLESRGAAPASITVTRGAQVASAKTYVLSDTAVGTDTNPDVSIRTTWRLTYTREDE